MKKFFIFCLFAFVALCGVTSCNEDPEAINNAPEVFVDEATELLRTSAVLTGRIMAPAKASIKEYGFKLSSTSDFSSADTQIIPMDGELPSFSTQITNLEIGGTYFYVSYASNGLDEMTSTLRTFTTPTRSGVLLSDFRLVDEATATFSARVGDTGGGEIHGVGFCWATDDTPTTYDKTVLTTLNGDNAFTASLSGLEAGMTYYVRAFADSDILGDGTTQTISYSRDVLEIRLEEELPEPEPEPSVSVEALSATATTLNFRVTSTAVEQVRHLVISEEALSVYGEITADFVFLSNYEIEPNTTVELSASDLTPATTYYIYAAAEADGLRILSEPVRMTTEDEAVTAAAPTITWRGQDIKQPTDYTENLPVVIDITAEAGIAALTVDIDSDILTHEELLAMGLDSHIDLINPGTMEEALNKLGFLTGASVEGQPALSIDISNLCNIIFMLSTKSSYAKFTITVGDTLSQKSSETLQLRFNATNSQVPESWKIYYTSIDGEIVEPHDLYAFGFDYATWTYPTIVSNSYSNGKGTIIFDKEITLIGDNAFMECTNLKSIIIPETVTSVGAYAFSNCSLSSILIPDAVAEIGNQAFSGCSKLASATIGQGVASIGAGAFYRCDSLETITIPDNVTTIGNEAFFNCDALVSATIGSGVTSIGGSVFYDCNKLETVYCYPTTPPVTSFGGATWSSWAAFDSCSTALKIYVPNASVTAYKTAEGWSDYADRIYPMDGEEEVPETWKIYYTSTDGAVVELYNATDSINKLGANLVSNTYENGEGVFIFDAEVTKIMDWTFRGAQTLKSITIPESVNEVHYDAFNECVNLAEFKGKYASSDGRCLIVNNTLTAFAWAGITEYTVPAVSHIGDYAFYNKGLTSVILPDNLLSLGKYALAHSRFVEISIPESVTVIGASALADCYYLTSVTIPQNVQTIGESAFCACEKLATVYCESTTPPVADYALAWHVFTNTSSDLKIYVPNASVTAYKTAEGWSDYADRIYPMDGEEDTTPESWKIYYTSTDGAVVELYNATTFGVNVVSNTYGNGQGVITFDGEVTTIGVQAFQSCANLAGITLPSTLTTIEQRAFSACTALQSITIPDRVNSIGDSAFNWCSSLEEIVIPEGVTAIAPFTFNNCKGLKSVTIPNGVTNIGYDAFYGCSSLQSITIPESVLSIESQAFYGCLYMESVYCLPTVPPAGAVNMFEEYYVERKIYVPSASVLAYQTAEHWNDYINIIYGYDF